jgi:hypothetical protein
VPVFKHSIEGPKEVAQIPYQNIKNETKYMRETKVEREREIR